MPSKNKLRAYALVHSAGAYSAGDHASLQAAAALASEAGGEAHALLLCTAANVAPNVLAAQQARVDSVSVFTLPESESPLQPQQVADLFASLLANTEPDTDDAGDGVASVIFVSAGTIAEEAAGAIAVRIDALPLGRPLRMTPDEQGILHVVRSGFGGRLEIAQRVTAARCIAAVRAPGSADEPARNEGREADAAVRTLPCPPLAPAYPVTMGASGENEANLEGARLIVSGGRGMGSEKGFELLREVAARLDGATAGSLPAVDAGWTSVSRQVGQSGKYVSPAIYLAVGISGTPQHLAGIDPHTRIIAVNNDPGAAIFGVASVGVVAAWEEFLPALLEALPASGSASPAS